MATEYNSSTKYRCPECGCVAESAEQLAGHYRVTRCSPPVMVLTR